MQPVAVDVIVRDGETVRTETTTVRAIATPGHSPGAMSWQWESCEEAGCLTIVYADSLSPVSADDYRFSDHPQYLAAFRASLDRIAALDCDIVLTPHPGELVVALGVKVAVVRRWWRADAMLPWLGIGVLLLFVATWLSSAAAFLD